jgi:hypothetical protein
VIDIARTRGFAAGVASADAAQHRKPTPRPLLTVAQLEAAVDRFGDGFGHAKVARVASFATPLSDSVKESESRVLIHEFGFPEPVLQKEWWDDEGHAADSDFWWPEFNRVGEYDGRSKYEKDEYLKGRSAAVVVLAEKRREDRIRALGAGVTRWDSDELARRTPVLRKLVAAGLPIVGPHRRAS